MAQLHPSPPLTQGAVRYEIQIVKERWQCLVVILGTHLAPTQGRLCLNIFGPDGAKLRESFLTLTPELNNSLAAFKFDPIEGSAGKTFTVEFCVDDATKQSRISLYETQDFGRGSVTQRIYRKLGVAYSRDALYFETDNVVVPMPVPATANPNETITPFVAEQFPEQSGLPNARVVKKATSEVCLLLPSLGSGSFSGGPNTAFILCAHLARRGIKINVISVNLRAEKDDVIRNHIRSLIADDSVLQNFRFTDGCDGTPTLIGENDVLMATAWWTALRANDLVLQMKRKRFIYLIQDFEPLFYGWTTHHAMAMATYGYDYVPVINEQVLAEFFFRFGPGKFNNPGFCRDAMVFQPAVDRRLFHPNADAQRANRKKQILFYARPSAPRNLFNMGMSALQQLVARNVITAQEWDVRLMGDQIAPIDLGNGVVLRAIPWMDYETYAANMREATVGLALMLSPHTSYPPLEMAASGVSVVTTVYSSKSAEKLARISRNLVSVEPSAASIAAGLERAMAASADRHATLAHAQIGMPATWEDAFAPIIDKLHQFIACKPAGDADAGVENTDNLVYSNFAEWRRARRIARKPLYPVLGSEPLFSVNTTVYDTPVAQIQDLERCLVAQEYPHFEWNILDNGSTNAETVSYLRTLPKRDARFTVWRVEKNLHIIGGNRYLLELSRNRYIVPIDSDDMIDPDAFRILAWYARQFDYPPMLYSDEEKVDAAGVSIEPIFRHSPSRLTGYSHCYFAHLSCFDRQTALRIGVYTEDYARGSHDWDTHFRFNAAGPREALHVPEILYSWRMSATSTAASSTNKDYIFDSQKQVLEHAVARENLGELFEFSQDTRKWPCYWVWARKPIRPPKVEIVFHVHTDPNLARTALDRLLKSLAGFPREAITLTVLKRHPDWRTPDSTGEFEIKTRAALKQPEHLAVNDAIGASTAEIVIVIDEFAFPDSRNWLWQTIGLFELDPKLVAASGRLVSPAPDEIVLTMPRFGGFEGHFAMPFSGIKNAALYNYPRRVGLDQNCSAIAMPWVALRRAFFQEMNGFAGDFSGRNPGGIEFCLRAMRQGYTCGFSGGVIFGSLLSDCDFGLDLAPLDRLGAGPAVIGLLEDYQDVVRDDPHYHPFLSLSMETFDRLEAGERRQETARRYVGVPEKDLLLPRADRKTTARYDLFYRLEPGARSKTTTPGS